MLESYRKIKIINKLSNFFTCFSLFLNVLNFPLESDLTKISFSLMILTLLNFFFNKNPKILANHFIETEQIFFLPFQLPLLV